MSGASAMVHFCGGETPRAAGKLPEIPDIEPD
jgi:hypothetical protein